MTLREVLNWFLDLKVEAVIATLLGLGTGVAGQKIARHIFRRKY